MLAAFVEVITRVSGLVALPVPASVESFSRNFQGQQYRNTVIRLDRPNDVSWKVNGNLIPHLQFTIRPTAFAGGTPQGDAYRAPIVLTPQIIFDNQLSTITYAGLTEDRMFLTLNRDITPGDANERIRYFTNAEVDVVQLNQPGIIEAPIARARSHDLTISSDVLDATEQNQAGANRDYRKREVGLIDAVLTLSRFYDVAEDFIERLKLRANVHIKLIFNDGANQEQITAAFKPIDVNISGDVESLEDEAISFNLTKPEAGHPALEWL